MSQNKEETQREGAGKKRGWGNVLGKRGDPRHTARQRQQTELSVSDSKAARGEDISEVFLEVWQWCGVDE